MEHTEVEEKIMNEYEASIDADVLNFVEETVAGTGKLNYVTVSFLSSSAAKRVKYPVACGGVFDFRQRCRVY